jgi:hypothetical protein
MPLGPGLRGVGSGATPSFRPRLDELAPSAHSALDMLTPTEFADQWTRTNQPQLS